MRWAGIDIGKGRHVVAVVDDQGRAAKRPMTFVESAPGFKSLAERLGPPDDLKVAMEATGHYWCNLARWLKDQGYQVMLFNPSQTARFAEAQMRRAKTDPLDALGIARCAMSVSARAIVDDDGELASLRELSRWRARLVQDLGDRVRQLHRQVDLVFPELSSIIKDLSTHRATALLGRWPTASKLGAASVDEVAALRYDGRHRIGRPLAERLVAAARATIAQHAGPTHELIVPMICDDVRRAHARLKEVDEQLRRATEANPVGKLLMSVPGIGPISAAAILAEVGNPARYKSANALAADVGVVPGVWQSGKTQHAQRSIDVRSKARLRQALWMPTLSAVRSSPWLKAFYERLKANGKRPKVAAVASMRKLLLAAYAVVKRGTPFEEPRLPPASAEIAQAA